MYVNKMLLTTVLSWLIIISPAIGDTPDCGIEPDDCNLESKCAAPSPIEEASLDSCVRQTGFFGMFQTQHTDYDCLDRKTKEVDEYYSKYEEYKICKSTEDYERTLCHENLRKWIECVNLKDTSK